MIKYDAGKWGIAFALSCNGSVFPKSWVIAFPAAVLCLVLHLMYHDRLLDTQDREYSGIATNVMAGFTSILGFLIVFRSQQGYGRWWEGATIMQQIRGEWVNAYSLLIAFSNPSEEKKQDVKAFHHKLVRLFSLLYAGALEQVTTVNMAVFEIVELEGFDNDALYALKHAHDRCEVVLQWIQREIVEQSHNTTILIEASILSRVFHQLGFGIVGLNNARKITEFPIPFPLAQMVTFMLACHWWLTLTMCVLFIDNAYHASSICFTVVFAFWTVNYIALELEMPYGDDPNDLPLEDMQRDYNQSLVELLQPHSLHSPKFEYKEEKHISFQVTHSHVDDHIDGLLGTHVPANLGFMMPSPSLDAYLLEPAPKHLARADRIKRKIAIRRKSQASRDMCSLYAALNEKSEATEPYIEAHDSYRSSLPGSMESTGSYNSSITLDSAPQPAENGSAPGRPLTPLDERKSLASCYSVESGQTLESTDAYESPDQAHAQWVAEKPMRALASIEFLPSTAGYDQIQKLSGRRAAPETIPEESGAMQHPQSQVGCKPVEQANPQPVEQVSKDCQQQHLQRTIEEVR